MNTNNVTVHVGKPRWGVALLMLVAGIIIGFVLSRKACTEKTFKALSSRDYSDEGIKSPLSFGTATAEEPVEGEVTTDTVFLTKVVYKKVPRELTAHEIDSILNVHYSVRSYTSPIEDKNITGVIYADVEQGRIVSSTLDYKLKKVNRTQYLVGTRLSANLSPMKVNGAEPFVTVIPRNGKWFGGVSYDPFNNIVSASGGIILNRKPL